MNLSYINTVAPEHNKTSCTDENRNNARYGADDFGGCYRCTLLEAGQPDEGPESDSDDEG